MDELVHWDGSNAPWQRDLQALRMLKAQVQKDLGNSDQARLTLSQVLPALQKLTTTDPSDLNRLRDLGWLHKDRGMLAASQGRWAEALPDLAQAERLYATAATGAPANLRWHQDWYWSIYALAQVQRDAGHPAQALVQLHKGRNLIDRLLRDAPQWTPLVQHRIRYFDAMALQLLNQPGDAKQADALLRQMQAVLDRALATARPAGPMLLVAAADVDSLRADRADTDGRTNDALALRRSSLAKARSAVDRDPADPLWWDYLAERAGALARQHANLARWTEAAAAYRDEIRPRERALELAPQQLMANIARVPATEDQKNQILQPRLPGQADTANQAPALAPALGSRANLLHVAQINLGDALEHADQPKPALQAYADALRSIDQAVALNEREAVYLHNRRNAWRRIAKLQAGLGNIQAALAAYEAAQPPGRLAFDRAVSAEDRASQANWLYLLTLEQGDLRAMQQGPNAATEAVAAYKNALPWIEKAAELVPKASLYQNNLAALYRRIATQQRNLKQGEQEIAALNKGLAAADLAARLAGPPDTAAEQASRHVERMHAYNEFADWQQRQGASAQALLARRTALAAIAQAGKLEPDRASHQDALGTAQRTIAQQESSPAAAGTAWRAAAAAALQAAALAASATRFNQAAQDLYGLGNHLNLQDDLAPALQAYQQAIQQLQRAMGADDQPDKHQRGMSVCQRMVAQTLKKLPGRSAEAGPALEAAVAAGSKATAWERDNIHAWQALYRARQELGLHLELAGQRAQGLAQLEQALHEAEQARKLDGGNGSVSTDIDELRLALAQRRPR